MNSDHLVVHDPVNVNKCSVHSTKKDDTDVVISVTYGVALFSISFKSICNPETGITRIRGTPKITGSFQRGTP